MLQIDHVYEFLYQNVFKDTIDLVFPVNGVLKINNVSLNDIVIFTPNITTEIKIFFYDQEPFIKKLAEPYIYLFDWLTLYKFDELIHMLKINQLPVPGGEIHTFNQQQIEYLSTHPKSVYKKGILASSERSGELSQYAKECNFSMFYYFFHGFAALDWYRGFYALNYNKQVIQNYTYDYITFNRLVSNDRSYRCYFVSQLSAEMLLENGQVSFGLATEQAGWQEEITDPNTKLSDQAIEHIQLHLPSTPLIIDSEQVLGSASADIPRCANDSFWHVVTETVFYYDKLHLTEKIFKPIVMKQPFMLLAAPGNLAYLKSYGFKTFEGIIDESYDLIQDPDQRTEAVVQQLAWYCSLSAEEKRAVIKAIAPIVEYNFHHFYGEFKHIITRELLDNTKTLFKEIGYNDSTVAYDDIYKVLTN
jgi:hypothetical protein